MNLYAVIMAGGVGSRFWPRSREKKPKQLLKIIGEQTMIQQTVKRLKGLIPDENILIVTNRDHRDEIVNQLPQLKSENVISEPFGRNTAPCIGVAAKILQKKDPEGVMIVLPADHYIVNENNFRDTLSRAAEYAFNSKGLVTIGVIPTRPETGYGYIQIEEKSVAPDIHKVYTFAEKPNYATAVRFLESGDFLWNSGMFIWRVDTVLEEISSFMPELASGLGELESEIFTNNFDEKLEDIYSRIKGISIDYGIMEKSQKVFLTKADFSWSDVGSWEEVYRLSNKSENGNSIVGDVFVDMTYDSYIFSPNKFCAVIGVNNIIVINSEDAMLVCRRDQSQEVKKIVDHLKHNKLTEYL